MGHSLVLKEVAGLRQKVPGMGVIKLHYLMRDFFIDHNIKMGRDKMYRLLGDYDLLIRRRSGRKPITTNSNHPFYKYKNLTEHLSVTRINQLWVSDITYMRVATGFCYLSLITDAFSRKIVGYHLASDLKTQGPLRALKMALDSYDHTCGQPLVHHSDRGLQYCCQQYVDILHKHRILISMTQNGDPYQNALAERMNGILKYDFELSKPFHSLKELTPLVHKAIVNYNNLRPHLSLKMATPQAVHEGQKAVKTGENDPPLGVKACFYGASETTNKKT